MESPAGSINAAGVVSALRHFLIGAAATAVLIVAGVIKDTGGTEAIENLNNGIDWALYAKALYGGLVSFALRFAQRWVFSIPAEVPGQAPQGFWTLLKRIF